MKAACTFALPALFLGAALAWAQPVYKSVMPDGRVVYGEKPAPGAAKVEKLEPPPAKTGISGLTPEEKARAEKLAKERAAAAAAANVREQELADARRQLQQAEAARNAGKEPLPGERLGVVGGGTRLSEAYFARQKQLEAAVAAARKRLEEAQAAAR